VRQPLLLIDNRQDEETLAGHLNRLLATATAAAIHVAYLRVSGVALVREQVEGLVRRGGWLRVLAGGDFAQTEPEALRFFLELGGDCQARLLSSSGLGGFHPKCYLVYAGEQASLVIGSSNFTEGGLQNNIELNVRVDQRAGGAAVVAARRVFDELWDATPPLSEERLADYTRFWERCRQAGPGLIYRLPPADKETEMPNPFVDPAALQPGDLVQCNGQEGEVMAVTRLGEHWSVKLALKGVGPRTLLAPPSQFQRVETPLGRAKRGDFDQPAAFDLLTEGTRLALAYEHDRLVSLSNSRTKLEPYQVDAVYKIVSAWEQRFLIADDVGLGKTVEVGMVVKELKARHRADKVLVLCPAGLARQWQREMREKFDEHFDIVSSSQLRQWRSTRPAGSPLSSKYPHAIASIDTAKRRDDENNAPDFTEAHCDVIIIDEAHKVAQHGQAEQRTARYKLARDLAPSCDALLLLSATPHDGDPFAFHSLLGLLDPLRFPNPEDINPRDLEPVMVRRAKADIRNEHGKPLFRPRWVETTEVRFTKEELDLYNAVTSYVREGYQAATALKDTAVGFVMVLLQKRMVSSIAAIRKTLERRLRALEHPETAALTPAELRELREREEDEEAVTDERREQLQAKLEGAQRKLTRAEHQAEITRVRKLLNLARGIKVDSKARELRKFVQGVLQKAPNEKLLIFTEYADTLNYLRDEVLKGLGPIAQIYGSMNMEERQAQEAYFQKADVRLMVATDAAGEGLNLQFCHLMVNYELPWNPNRIEQRIGRLHRYGQGRDVRVYNLQVVNTREGFILARLLHKIEMIEKQMGGYAPNILGTADPSAAGGLNRLSDLIINAIAHDTPQEVTAEHVELAVEARREMYDQLEKDLFLPLHRFNKGEADAVIRRSTELTPSNKDIEAFVRRYFEAHEGKVENTRQARVLRLRPPRHLVDGKAVQAEYPQATFDKDTAFKLKASAVQFIAFGHPLLEAVIRECRCRLPVLRGAVTVKRVSAKTLGAAAGVLFNYTLRYADAHDQTLREEFLPVFVGADGQVDTEKARQCLYVPGAAVKDPRTHTQVAELLASLDELESLARQAAGDAAQQQFDAVQAERGRQAEACLRSLERFRKAKADRLTGTIDEYEHRLAAGEDMDIAIRRGRLELAELEDHCEARRRVIEGRRAVQVDAPSLVNVALLVTRA
jgi:superfamily II DNA or RNA helicase/HKD family nuclease